MIVSFPSTALRSNQREVKDASKKDPVLITDNEAHYVLGGKGLLGSMSKRLRERAAYEQRIVEAVERGNADFAAGRYIEGNAEEVIAEMERKRLAHG